MTQKGTLNKSLKAEKSAEINPAEANPKREKRVPLNSEEKGWAFLYSVQGEVKLLNQRMSE